MNKIIFSKYSNDRNINYQIRTDMLINEAGERLVRKHPCSNEAANRLEYVDKMYELLKEQFEGSVFVPNKAELKDGELWLEYIKGENLVDRLHSYEQEKRINEYTDTIVKYVNAIRNRATASFEVTGRFTEIFGEPDKKIEDKTLSVSDIDMIFDNIICVGDEWVLLDYEWTFDFPIPVGYILYRTFMYLGKPSEDFIASDRIMELMGIDRDMIPYYDEMEKNFQDSINKDHSPLWRLYETIGKGLFNPNEAKKNSEFAIMSRRIQVFKGYDEGLEGIEDYYTIMPDMDGNITFEFDARENLRSLRVDPAERKCSIYVKEFTGFNPEPYPVSWESNGEGINGEVITFDTTDPQIIATNIRENTTHFKIVFNADYLSDFIIDKYKKISKIAIREKELSRIHDEEEALIQELKEELEALREYKDTNEGRMKTFHEETEVVFAKLYKTEEKLKNLESSMNASPTSSDGSEDVNQLRQECERLKLELELQKQEFTNSTSWKLTKPLRAAKKIVGGGKE